MDKNKALVVFQDKKIRRTWHDNEWYFSVVDVVSALTESLDAKDYWYKVKKREFEANEIELSTFCRQLKLPAEDSKMRLTVCANIESMFRIIQFIPSKNPRKQRDWRTKRKTKGGRNYFKSHSIFKP